MCLEFLRPRKNRKLRTNQENPNLKEERFEIQLSTLTSRIDSVEDDFWRQVYDRLRPDYRRDLFRLLRFVSDEISADDEKQEQFRTITKFLSKRRKSYQSQLFQHITSLPESQLESKKAWNEVLFQIQKSWN